VGRDDVLVEFDAEAPGLGHLDVAVLDQGVAGTFQGSFDGSDDTGDPLDGDTFTYTASDVKPGDDGLFAFCPRIEDNPAYLWLQGELTANDDNGLTEPEGDVDETGGEGEGELAQNIDVTVSYCDIDDDVADQPEGDEDPSDDGFGPDDMTVVAEVWSGSLAGLLEELEAGLPLDGGVVEPGEEPIGFPELGTQGCFAGTGEEGENYCLCFDWEVPEDVGNVIQSDSLSFDLTLYAEQCRHNDGATNPFEEEEEEEETQTPVP
jgi:hypothetical protein